jgi:hypothetical protein
MTKHTTFWKKDTTLKTQDIKSSPTLATKGRNEPSLTTNQNSCTKKVGRRRKKGDTGTGRGGKEMTNKHRANCLQQGARHPWKKRKKATTWSKIKFPIVMGLKNYLVQSFLNTYPCEQQNIPGYFKWFPIFLHKIFFFEKRNWKFSTIMKTR